MSKQKVHESLAPATVDAPAIAMIAGGVLVFLGASMGILALIFFNVVPADRTPAAQRAPEPRLQADRSGDMQQTLAKQRNQLAGYRWASSDHSLVAIPVERAMEIVAKRGAKGYEPIAPANAASSPQGDKP